MDDLTTAYIVCALWSSTDDADNPLDLNYDIDDLHPDTLAVMQADCNRFQDENSSDILNNPIQAGHDFWLTRNHHGAGFWDGDWPKTVGERLTAVAQNSMRSHLW